MEFDTEEVQSDDHAAIATRAAVATFDESGGPVFVEDSRLFIDALESFPGPYSSYVYGTLGIERVAVLARREDDVRARF